MSTSSQNSKRPTWLVIFKPETSAASIKSLCRKAAGNVAAKALAATTTATRKEAKTAESGIRWTDSKGVVQGVYPMLKVAAMDLDDKARTELEKAPNVLEIVPNKQRHILGFASPSAPSSGQVRLQGGVDGNVWPFGGVGGNPFPFGGGGGNPWPFAAAPGMRPKPVLPPQATEPFGGNGGNSWPWSDAGSGASAYLRGIRDLADLLLQEHSASGISARRRQAFVDSSRLTWGLQAVGVKGQDNEFTGRGIAVAVLDTGLDLQHPDFVGRVNPADCASFVEGVATVQDGHGHGTHCCGTVAGPTTPASGPRYGVAPDVRLLVGKVLSDEGSGWDSDIIAGIQWAAENGAQVISLSLGSSRDVGESHSDPYETAAASLAEEGRNVLLVAAAGNDSSRRQRIKAPVGNPAACPSFMSVGAVDASLQVADFSCAQMDNIGLLDISGPGVDIHSAATGGGYVAFDGTSMATPHVAGVAALYLQSEPELSVSDLWAKLELNARPLGNHLDYGRGLVQVP